MRIRLTVPEVALATCVLLAVPTPSAAQGAGWGDGRVAYTRAPTARIWIENHRDSYHSGDRLRVRFSASVDAFVAVLHIDPAGTLDFLYPRSPWDDGYVRGGRVHSLPAGYASGWPVRGSTGIGYLYVIASPEPLDFSYFGSRYTTGWDWSYGGRLVGGDPFWALEQITRLLLPGWQMVPYVYDHYSYYVGGYHRYPTYACGDPWRQGWTWGWYSGLHSCDRMDHFLRQYPYYYDSRRYRGDRRAYFGDRAPVAPFHGFKEPPDRAGARTVSPDAARSSGVARQPARPGTAPVQPDARRPTLERRDGGRSPAVARPPARAPDRSPAAPTTRARPKPGGDEAAEPATAAPTRPATEASRSSGGSARPAPAAPSSRGAPSRGNVRQESGRDGAPAGRRGGEQTAGRPDPSERNR